MSKLLKATKKISAIAASALMLSSASFANLSNYNSHFEKSGEFVGEVVVGSGVGADDSESANVVIADLRDRYSGEAMVELKYSRSSSSDGGEVVSAIKDNNALNYGETVGDNSENSGYDDTDFDMLEDGEFENDLKDVDFEQTLTLQNGKFNYRLYDDVGEDEIMDGVYYSDGQAFAVYDVSFNTDIVTGSSSDDDTENLIGGTMTLMGQEFTVGRVDIDASTGVSEVDLLGGANKFSLSEGESQTVTFDGKSVEIQVTNVDSDGKTRIVVNGVADIVSRYDIKEVNGIDIAVIDSVGATGDGIVGAAEFIVGGSKVTLKENGVEVNEEELDDIYPEYDVELEFTAGGNTDDYTWEGFTLTYRVDEDTLLKEGDSLTEVLFNTFSLVYEGTNEPEYESVTIKTGSEDVTFSGDLRNGESIPNEFKLTYDEDKTVDGGAFYLGDNDNRIYFEGSKIIEFGSNTDFGTQTDSVDDVIGIVETEETTSKTYDYDSTATNNATEGSLIESVAFDLSQENKFKGFGFFVNEKQDEQYLYSFSSVSFDATTFQDTEIDFNEVIEEKDEENLNPEDLVSDIEGGDLDDAPADGTAVLTVGGLGSAEMALANYMTMDFTNVETAAEADATPSVLSFYLDTSEVDVDQDEQDAFVFDVEIVQDHSDDERAEIKDVVTAHDIASGVTVTTNASTAQSEIEAALDTALFTAAADAAAAVDISSSGNDKDAAKSLILDALEVNHHWVNSGDADESDGSDTQVLVNNYGTKVRYDDSDGNDKIEIMTPSEQVEGMVNLVFGNVEMSEATKVVKSSEADEEYARLQEEGFSVERSDLEASDVEFSVTAPVSDNEASGENMIVVGGPAVNSQARALLGMSDYSVESAGLSEGQAVVRYFSDKNSVLAYGWSKAGTMAAVKRLVDGSAVDNQKFDE